MTLANYAGLALAVLCAALLYLRVCRENRELTQADADFNAAAEKVRAELREWT